MDTAPTGSYTSGHTLSLHDSLSILGGSDGAQGHAVEFAGEGVAALDIGQRQTLCNMATEMSAFCAIIAPDEQVFAALEGRLFAPHGAAWDAAVAQWRGRSEAHTSELQSLMRISYAAFCLTKKHK